MSARLAAQTAMHVRRTLIERGKARVIMWNGNVANGADCEELEAWIEFTSDYLADAVGHLAALPVTVNRKNMIKQADGAIALAIARDVRTTKEATLSVGQALTVVIGELVEYLGLFTLPKEESQPTPEDKRAKSIELARKRAERETPPSSDDEASALGAMALRVRDLEKALKLARELNIEHSLRISMMHRQVSKVFSGDYMPTPDAVQRAMYVSRDALKAEVARMSGKGATPKD